MSGWVVCSDFDGTICMPDSSEYLLERFAPPDWKNLDEAVWGGQITEREAFQKQISLLRVTWDDARVAVREGVKIRDGFKHFVQCCRARDLPLVILSSGLRPLIEELLQREGIAGLPVESHDVLIDHDRWNLILHRGRRLAEHCSHCKCAFLTEQQTAGRRVIYIGDGFTDLCPARLADMLFAADRLAEACRMNQTPFHLYTTFHDIERTLDAVFPLTTQESPL